MSNIYYHGDQMFLYVSFIGKIIENPQVKIIKTMNDTPLLDWTLMKEINSNEYYYDGFYLPYNISYGKYQIIYRAIVDGQDSITTEEFDVSFKKDINNNIIRVYGYVHKEINGVPIHDVKVVVHNNDQNKINFECYTSKMGLWEVFLEPGNYKFCFDKYGYSYKEVTIILNDSQEDIQFNNITLSEKKCEKLGKGNYIVNDKYVTKEGLPLVGLIVEAFKIEDINNIYAETKSDIEGKWELYLDIGIYLIKVKGRAYNQDFDLKFRLKVTEDDFKFENITNNIGKADEGLTIGRGNGSIEITDEVLDSRGNPAIDVMVQVFNKKDLNKLIAQDYTDLEGKWKVYLDPGNYQFEFFHPDFNVLFEDRLIK